MEKSDTTMIDSSLSVFTDDTESDDIMVISMSSFSIDEGRTVKRETRESREAAAASSATEVDELTEVDTDSIMTLSDDDDISLVDESFSRSDDGPSESNNRVLVITNSDWSKQDMKIVRLLCESLIKRDNEFNQVESLTISRIFKDTLYVKCKLAYSFNNILRSQSIKVEDQDRLEFLPGCNTHTLVIKHHASAIDSVEMYLSKLLMSPVEVDLIAEDCLIAKLETSERCDQILSMKHSIDGNHELIIEYLYNIQLLNQALIKSQDPREELFSQYGSSFMTSSVIIPKLIVTIDKDSQPLLSVLKEFDPAWTELCAELLKLSATASFDESGRTLRIECNDDSEAAHLTWSDEVKQLVAQFLSQLVSKQVKFNAEELQKLSPNNERLRIKETDDGCLVSGYKNEVEDLIKTAEDLENSRENTITLDGFLPHQLKMMLRCKFIANMTQKHQMKRDQILIDLNTGSVTIRGTSKQIRHAKEEIKEIIGSIVNKEIKLDPMIIKFIKKRESELVEWLISRGYRCVLSADMTSSVLTIYSTSRQNDTDKCFNGLTEAIQCQKVDRALILNIEEEELLDFLNEVTNPYRGAIYHYQDRSLKLCGFTAELQSIAEKFTQQFIK